MKKALLILISLMGSTAMADSQKFQLAYRFKDEVFQTPVVASSFDQAIEKGSQACITHMFSKFRISNLSPDEKHMLASSCANPRTI